MIESERMRRVLVGRGRNGGSGHVDFRGEEEEERRRHTKDVLFFLSTTRSERSRQMLALLK